MLQLSQGYPTFQLTLFHYGNEAAVTLLYNTAMVLDKLVPSLCV
jgi:hypothetical protein